MSCFTKRPLKWLMCCKRWQVNPTTQAAETCLKLWDVLSLPKVASANVIHRAVIELFGVQSNRVPPNLFKHAFKHYTTLYNILVGILFLLTCLWNSSAWHIHILSCQIKPDAFQVFLAVLHSFQNGPAVSSNVSTTKHPPKGIQERSWLATEAST